MEKELRAGGEVLLAQVMMILPDKEKHLSEALEMQSVLNEYEDVFKEPTSLPPHRQFDHSIVLEPNSKLVNLRPYQYSYFQKLELEKPIEELL